MLNIADKDGEREQLIVSAGVGRGGVGVVSVWTFDDAYFKNCTNY